MCRVTGLTTVVPAVTAAKSSDVFNHLATGASMVTGGFVGATAEDVTRSSRTRALYS